VSPLINEGTDLALRFGATGGQTFVQSSSPLTRLNYFDGKFLRADDLRTEQNYLRQLVQFSNQGLGAGVVYGMDTTLDDKGRIAIGPGLATDSTGRTLLIPNAAAFDVGPLIDASRRIALAARTTRILRAPATANAEFGDCVDVTGAPGGDLGQGVSLYIICVGHAESLCGTEDVFGRLCEEACITATDRPFIVEGVIVRALPLTLRTPLATSHVIALNDTHLRSLVASAFFEDERHVVESLISRAGLSLDVWCVGAEAASVGCVPLAVVARSGTTTKFLDAWTARRERIETPARRYWAWRMAMRPWDVYLAQILQFQCQLHEVLGAAPDPGKPTDPCDPQRKLLDEAAGYLRQIDESYARHVDALTKLGTLPDVLKNDDVAFRLQGGGTDLAALRLRIDGALKVMIGGSRERVLINGGIVELPSAGYLPVVPGTVSVNTQVRRMMGDGVDLRFCVVRPDFVAHALEEAQHMERISLLTGLDDPNAKQQVDILVPNGDITTAEQAKLSGFDTQVRINRVALSAAAGAAINPPKASAKTAAKKAAATTDVAVDETAAPLVLHGAGRAERLQTGGAAFYFAGGQEATVAREIVTLADGVRQFAVGAAKTRSDLFKRAAGAPAMSEAFVRASVPTDDVVARFNVGAATARTERSEIALMESAPSLVRTPQQPALVSLWSSMRCDRDPYTMSTADTTPLSLEVVLTSQVRTATSSELHVLVRLRVQGTFTVTQLPADTSAGRLMGGHFSGTFSTQILEESTAGTNHATPFEVEATLLRSGSAASGQLRVALVGTRMMFATDVTWGGNPMAATVKLSVGVNTATKSDSGEFLKASLVAPQLVELLAANLVVSDDALKEGSALRMLSTSAIELIGDEMSRANQGGPAFVDASERALFPPPPPPVDDLTVRPTLDWVLFHRRRTKRCAMAAAAPPQSPSRRYQVYHLAADADAEVRIVRAALRTPDGITKLQFQRVDVVEFAGGLPTLLSANDVLLRDWTAVHPGNRLLYGAIATPIATDTPPLEDARLSRVVQALASVSPVDANSAFLAFETLPQVPAALAVPGTDGIIFLVSETLVLTTCQDVYRVIQSDRVPVLLKQGDLVTLLKLDGVKQIASVQFNEGSNAPTTASLTELQKAWTAAGDTAPSHVVVFPKPNDTSGGDANTRVARGHSIADAIGATPNTLVTSGVLGSAWPAGPTCPVVTIAVVRATRTVRVVATRFGNLGEANVQRVGLQSDVVTLDAGVLRQDADLQFLIRQLQQATASLMFVASAQLATRGAPDADAMNRLTAIVKDFEAANPPVIVSTNLQKPLGTHAATGAEIPVLDENNQSVDDLLLLTIFEEIG